MPPQVGQDQNASPENGSPSVEQSGQDMSNDWLKRVYLLGGLESSVFTRDVSNSIY